MQTIFISIGFALCAMLLLMVGVRVFAKASNDYRKAFTDKTTASLRDLFLFLDSETLYRLNVALIALATMLVWLASGVWVLAIIAGIVAAFLPKAAFSILRKRRMEMFVLQLPEALLSISGAMKAGASLVQAMEVMVAETKGPIAQEFGLFLRELRVGVTYDDALGNLVERVPNEELRLVVAGMRISREIGGNLAETLARLSDTLRKKIEMEGKIKALTAQGRMQGIVMALLPIFLGVVLYYMEPEHMRRLFTEPFGWATIAVVVIVEALGYFFIRKIVNIDV